jgi:hypothetical protein
MKKRIRLQDARLATLVAAAMLVAPGVSLAATPPQCSSAEPTAASYTWDFHKEASDLLNGLRVDARKARSAADQLRAFENEPEISWQSHADRLAQIKNEVNDMGAKLCRLEAIRSAALPWQQKAIDDVAPAVRLMADNVDDAILYLNAHQGNFWVPAYDLYVTNLSTQSGHLEGVVHNFEQYARLNKELSSAQKSIQMPSGF